LLEIPSYQHGDFNAQPKFKNALYNFPIEDCEHTLKELIRNLYIVPKERRDTAIATFISCASALPKKDDLLAFLYHTISHPPQN